MKVSILRHANLIVFWRHSLQNKDMTFTCRRNSYIIQFVVRINEMTCCKKLFACMWNLTFTTFQHLSSYIHSVYLSHLFYGRFTEQILWNLQPHKTDIVSYSVICAYYHSPVIYSQPINKLSWIWMHIKQLEM